MIENRVVITKINSAIVSVLLCGKRMMKIDISTPDSDMFALCRGRIERIDKKAGYCYVKTSLGKNAFLPLKDGHLSFGSKEPLQGDLISFQITKDETDVKLTSGDTNISLTGRFVVITSRPGIHFSQNLASSLRPGLNEFANNLSNWDDFGIIFRSSCAEIKEEYYPLITEEIQKLSQKMTAFLCRSKAESEPFHILTEYPELLSFLNDLPFDDFEEIVTDIPEIAKLLRNLSFSKTHTVRLYEDHSYPLRKLYDIDSCLQSLSEHRIWLQSGANIVLDTTEAFVIFDVNSAKSANAYKNKSAAFEVNKEAAIEIVRQIILRNLFGTILIDFINMKSKEEEAELLRLMTDLSSDDKQNLTTIDFTSLGIMQLTRKKKSLPIHEKLKVLTGE